VASGVRRPGGIRGVCGHGWRSKLTSSSRSMRRKNKKILLEIGGNIENNERNISGLYNENPKISWSRHVERQP
jgi:hypothetical protein